MQEIEQQLCAAAFEAQMNVRDKDCSQSQRRRGVTLSHGLPPRSLSHATFAISHDDGMTPGRRIVYKKGTYAWNIAWNTKNVT